MTLINFNQNKCTSRALYRSLWNQTQCRQTRQMVSAIRWKRGRGGKVFRKTIWASWRAAYFRARAPKPAGTLKLSTNSKGLSFNSPETKPNSIQICKGRLKQSKRRVLRPMTSISSRWGTRCDRTMIIHLRKSRWAIIINNLRTAWVLVSTPIVSILKAISEAPPKTIITLMALRIGSTHSININQQWRHRMGSLSSFSLRVSLN